MPIREPYTGVWALDEEKNIYGLILADNKSKEAAEIFSFYVTPEYRNKGIGTTLLKKIEEPLKARGVKTIYSRYWSNWKSKEYIENLLRSLQWEKPALLRNIAEVDISDYSSAVWPEVKLMKNLEIFGWGELTQFERLEIESLLGKNLIPPEFNPFRHEENICLPASMGLRTKNEIVGWNIVYNLTQDMLEYNNLFIRKEYQSLGYAINLLHASFAAQHQLGVKKATWLINADNTVVLKIARRIAGPYIRKSVDVFATKKTL